MPQCLRRMSPILAREWVVNSSETGRVLPDSWRVSPVRSSSRGRHDALLGAGHTYARQADACDKSFVIPWSTAAKERICRMRQHDARMCDRAVSKQSGQRHKLTDE